MADPTLQQRSVLLNARGPLWEKFRGAVIKLAAYIYEESPAIENHTNRLAWAVDVLFNQNHEKRTLEMYLLGMGNTTVVSAGDAATDNDVEYVVNYFVNAVANTGA